MPTVAERFIGIHFMNQVRLMELVEIFAVILHFPAGVAGSPVGSREALTGMSVEQVRVFASRRRASAGTRQAGSTT